MRGPPKREREPARAPVGHGPESQRQIGEYQNPLLPAINLGERLRVIAAAFRLRIAAKLTWQKAAQHYV